MRFNNALNRLNKTSKAIDHPNAFESNRQSRLLRQAKDAEPPPVQTDEARKPLPTAHPRNVERKVDDYRRGAPAEGEGDLTAAETALAAEQLLLGRTCDTCRWRRRTDRAEGGRLVLVAEICMRLSRTLPEARTCGGWVLTEPKS